MSTALFPFHVASINAGLEKIVVQRLGSVTLSSWLKTSGRYWLVVLYAIQARDLLPNISSRKSRKASSPSIPSIMCSVADNRMFRLLLSPALPEVQDFQRRCA